MMDDWFWLYLITRASSFQALFVAIAVISGSAVTLAVIGWIGNAVHGDDDWAASCRRLATVLFFAVTLPAAIAATIIPSTKDLYFIVGGSAVIDVARTDDARRLTDKSVQAIERWLDERIQEER